MAKPFYSLDEVTSRLGKTPDEVKALAREGVLREFRDAGKVFYKSEDVERLAASAAARPASSSDSGEILLEPAEESASAADEPLPSLMDAAGGTSIIGLEPIGEEEPPARPPNKKSDTVISKAGIGVFDDDELEIDADPMAKTQITGGAVDDQVQLETGSSGSGLLDLTREADDTSLGAELLDEIYPGEEEQTETRRPAARVPAPAAAAEPEPVDVADAGEVLIPTAIATGDPSEGLFGGLLVGALLVTTVAASVAAGVLQNFMPTYGVFLSNNFLYFALGALVLVGLSLLIGWFVGNAMSGPRRR